jgi:undecaprenyl diphosphate synthase
MKAPSHIAIIMDGNRRWAKIKKLSVFEGHRKGIKIFEEIAKHCQKRGVKILTVFAFSTENWNRSKKEIDFLLKLFLKIFYEKNIKELQNRKVKLNVIGQTERFPKRLQRKIKEVEEITKNNKKFILNIALSYGGRADITESIKKILKKGISSEKITEDLISKNLWTQGLPDPDLIIRTGGENRISNFLIWQSAYSELYFTNKYWPEFTEKDLDEALIDYSSRQRRFGK